MSKLLTFVLDLLKAQVYTIITAAIILLGFTVGQYICALCMLLPLPAAVGVYWGLGMGLSSVAVDSVQGRG